MNTFTHDDLFNIRIALSDERHKWFLIWQEAQNGKGTISTTGAKLVMEEYDQLHQRLVQMTE